MSFVSVSTFDSYGRCQTVDFAGKFAFGEEMNMVNVGGENSAISDLDNMIPISILVSLDYGTAKTCSGD